MTFLIDDFSVLISKSLVSVNQRYKFFSLVKSLLFCLCSASMVAFLYKFVWSRSVYFGIVAFIVRLIISSICSRYPSISVFVRFLLFGGDIPLEWSSLLKELVKRGQRI